MGKERARAAPAPAVTVLAGYPLPAVENFHNFVRYNTQHQGPKGMCILQSSICKKPSLPEAAQVRC